MKLWSVAAFAFFGSLFAASPAHAQAVWVSPGPVFVPQPVQQVVWQPAPVFVQPAPVVQTVWAPAPVFYRPRPRGVLFGGVRGPRGGFVAGYRRW